MSPTGAGRVALAIVVFTLVVFGPIVAAYDAQPASRYVLTAALAENHTVDVGPFGTKLGIDRATYNGHLRSDKAPGGPVLGVPVYLAGRLVGAESASHLRATGDLGLWWQTFWLALVPLALLIALMYVAVRRYAPEHAAVAAIGLGFGTMLLVHGVNLYGHVLAALLGFAAWVVIERDRSPGRLVAAGALAAAAVTVEYDAGIVLVVVAACALWWERRRFGWFVLGAVGPLAALGWYQYRAFGAPWRTAHEYYATADLRREIVGFHFPDLHGLNSTFLGTRGVLITGPILLVAIGAAYLVARQPGPARMSAIVGIAIAIGYLIMCAGWRGTPALEEPGPRYAIPMIPFLAVPLAVAWDRVRKIAVVAIAWGAALMVAGAFTFLLVTVHDSPLRAYSRRVLDRDFAPTVWSMAFGWFGVVLYLVSVAAAGYFLLDSLRREHTNHEQMFVSAGRTRYSGE